MIMSRRHLLASAALAPFGGGLLSSASSQAQSPAAGSLPPIVFVHGNGDHAALWLTTLWRFESNGVPSDRLLAVNFTDPLARSDDAVPQANRSSTEDQRRELAEAVADLSRRTGAARAALVANSRGGYAIRNLLQNGGSEGVSHAVLCGVPNHGVYDWDEGVGGEFNGRGPFLRRLNAGETEVTPGTAYLTIRSDGNDKYAQPDGRFVGKPGVPTGVTAEGPALRGATNTVLPGLDHREVAFHTRAFREMYRFIAGAEPARIAIAPRGSCASSTTRASGAAPTSGAGGSPSASGRARSIPRSDAGPTRSRTASATRFRLPGARSRPSSASGCRPGAERPHGSTRRNTTVRLLAGISMTSCSAKLFSAARAATASRSRTPHSGLRRRRSASKASFDGAV
jgi:pimeloyl-ACP methyl ester carboxylesterase